MSAASYGGLLAGHILSAAYVDFEEGLESCGSANAHQNRHEFCKIRTKYENLCAHGAPFLRPPRHFAILFGERYLVIIKLSICAYLGRVQLYLLLFLRQQDHGRAPERQQRLEHQCAGRLLSLEQQKVHLGEQVCQRLRVLHIKL